jgi:protein SCO1/2
MDRTCNLMDRQIVTIRRRHGEPAGPAWNQPGSRDDHVGVKIARGLLPCLMALSLIGAVACGSSTEASSSATTEALAFKGIVRTNPLQVGGVTLPEESPGTTPTPFAFRAAPGELLVGYFGYTSCPDVCPTTLSQLKAARQKVGPTADAVDLAMVTVDPQRDTAEVLDGYLSHFSERHHVIRTTDPAQLRAAEDAFGATSSVTTTPEGTVEVAHSGTTYVIDEQGTVLVEWPFGISTEDMANDLRVALARVGTAPTGTTP